MQDGRRLFGGVDTTRRPHTHAKVTRPPPRTAIAHIPQASAAGLPGPLTPTSRRAPHSQTPSPAHHSHALAMPDRPAAASLATPTSHRAHTPTHTLVPWPCLTGQRRLLWLLPPHGRLAGRPGRARARPRGCAARARACLRPRGCAAAHRTLHTASERARVHTRVAARMFGCRWAHARTLRTQASSGTRAHVRRPPHATTSPQPMSTA